MREIGQLKLTEKEKKALQELKQGLLERFVNTEVILYGSKSRGDSEEFSDIDLLIVLDGQVDRNLREEISEVKYELELKYDVILGTIIENRDFWESPLAKAMPLHWNIDREGIRL